MTDAGARIHEGGYRPYDGERRGAAYSAYRLSLHSLQRIVGIRRSARSKVLPILSIVIAYLPGAVFIGLTVLLPRRLARGVVPTPEGYYGLIINAIILFVAFCAPVALTADRRSRALSLYLAAPLTRTTYLVAQAAAIAVAICALTLGPPLLLVVGLSLQGLGPDGPLGLAATLLRVVAAGGALAAIYTSVSLAVSSLTDRFAFAASGTLLLILMTEAVSDNLVRSSGAPEAVRLLSPSTTGFELAHRIYGKPGQFPIATTSVVAAAVAWSVAGAALAWWRYQRLQVTR